MVGKHPDWLRQQGLEPSVLENMKRFTDGLSLHTVCESAQCPNQGKCFSRGTATFLIMGDICTRNCRFCAIKKGTPLPLDPDEPKNVARAAEQLKLKHVVITSVTRDDLPDGGAFHFARVVTAIHEMLPDAAVEILVPDFQGDTEALRTVVASTPEVINHNIETVPRLYHEVRIDAEYERSLDLLELIKSWNPGIVTKSGLMLGLGENDYEVVKVMEDLLASGCNCITLGQYLPPSTKHHELVRYVTPQEFDEYQSLSMQMGYCSSRSGPFVRSSFDACEMYKEIAQ